MLEALPPGSTSLFARRTPNFNAPVLQIGAGQQEQAFSQSALSQDPRALIKEADIYTLRVWMKAVLGNSWREDLTLDDVMRMNPQTLYKAACLYLQGKYWGALPDDWMGDSQPGTPAYEWPGKFTPLQQDIFYWDLKMVPQKVPSYLAEDVQSQIWLPIIRPSKLVQKFDDQQGRFRVLNLGNTDRHFSLSVAGGAWEMSGWDFDQWARSTGFMQILQVVGIAVIAVAAAVTGGAALIAGEGLMAAMGAATTAAQTASMILDGVTKFAVAINNQDIGGALTAIAGIVKTTLNVDVTDLKQYQPGIDQLKAYLDPVIKLGTQASGDLFKAIADIGGSIKELEAKTEKLLITLNTDVVRAATGMFPEAFMGQLKNMTTTEIGVVANKIGTDIKGKIDISIKSVEDEIPPYLKDWYAFARGKGSNPARAYAPQVPWYGRTAYDAGTVAATLYERTKQLAVPDLNQLTDAQKRALFFGDITKVAGVPPDPQTMVNAAEYLRQADLFWFGSNELPMFVKRYNLG